MKRLILLGILLVMVCGPLAAFGDTWGYFIWQLEEAMQGAEGEFVYAVPETVGTGYESPLTVPEGVQLILEGEGSGFGGLLIGGGDITLRGKGMTARQITFAVDPASRSRTKQSSRLRKALRLKPLCA
jgi:hypothetical protein